MFPIGKNDYRITGIVKFDFIYLNCLDIQTTARPSDDDEDDDEGEALRFLIPLQIVLAVGIFVLYRKCK